MASTPLPSGRGLRPPLGVPAENLKLCDIAEEIAKRSSPG